MNTKHRILHVLNTSSFSGAENVVCQIIHMFRNDADIEMAYASPDGPIRDALAERGCAFFPMTVLNRGELRRVVREFKPELIHAHDVRATVLASLLGTRFLSTMHVNDVRMRSPNIKGLLYCAAARRAGHIFWVSGSSFEQYYFRRRLAAKSSILPNVIDRAALLDKMRTDPRDYAYDVVYVGRLSAQKNPLKLIDVLSLAVAENPGLKAAVIGAGDLEDAVKARAAELGIRDNVFFAGYMSNPLKLLHDAKVMVMTSLWEGTPMCALEAIALGVPIVSTPVDGMTALVEDGKTGFLCDDSRELAARIAEIAARADVYEQLHRNTLEKADALLDIQKYRTALLPEYRRLFQPRDASPAESGRVT